MSSCVLSKAAEAVVTMRATLPGSGTVDDCAELRG